MPVLAVLHISWAFGGLQIIFPGLLFEWHNHKGAKLIISNNSRGKKEKNKLNIRKRIPNQILLDFGTVSQGKTHKQGSLNLKW